MAEMGGAMWWFCFLGDGSKLSRLEPSKGQRRLNTARLSKHVIKPQNPCS
jgi:hypothetical protein